MNVNPKRYKAIIVDDDEIDRLTTLAFCKKIDFLSIEALFNSSHDAATWLEQNDVDVLLLDIDMEGLNGLDLRRATLQIPVCIFITSHAEYALESFELSALDYLIKPLQSNRFELAMTRLQEYMLLREKAELLDYSLGGDAIFIKEGHQQIKLHLHEVQYLEALKDYTGIVTGQRKYCVLSPFSNMLKQHVFQKFIRIHRSYAVQKNYVTRVTPRELFINNISLPIGRNYKADVEINF